MACVMACRQCTAWLTTCARGAGWLWVVVATKLWTSSRAPGLTCSPLLRISPSNLRPLFLASFVNTLCSGWVGILSQLWGMVRMCGGRVGKLVMTRRMRSIRSEEHTSELQSRYDLVCRLLHEKRDNSC